MRKNKRNYSKKNISNGSSNEGLTKSDKQIAFYFGIFIILITGTRVFYNLPGTDKQKKQTLLYYLAGLLFWIFIVILIIIFWNEMTK